MSTIANHTQATLVSLTWFDDGEIDIVELPIIAWRIQRIMEGDTKVETVEPITFNEKAPEDEWRLIRYGERLFTESGDIIESIEAAVERWRESKRRVKEAQERKQRRASE